MSAPLLQLDAAKVIETVGRLERRIDERFPGSGLSHVAGSLRQVADVAQKRARRARRPNIPLRIAIGIVLGVMAAVIVFIATQLHFRDAGAWAVLEGIEAAIGSFVFLAAAAIFLVTLEARIKRRRSLEAIEELRELAHIIDMHQLTKDPDRVCRPHPRTASSPTETMTPFQLSRYLDYCAELLSLIGKVVMIHSQNTHDSVILGAVDAIESLTSGLSRKIWQKIIILDRLIGKTADPGAAVREAETQATEPTGSASGE